MNKKQKRYIQTGGVVHWNSCRCFNRKEYETIETESFKVSLRMLDMPELRLDTESIMGIDSPFQRAYNNSITMEMVK